MRCTVMQRTPLYELNMYFFVGDIGFADARGDGWI